MNEYAIRWFWLPAFESSNWGPRLVRAEKSHHLWIRPSSAWIPDPQKLWAASHTKFWGDLLLSHSNSLDWFSMHCWCMFWWDSSLSSNRTTVYCHGPADHCGNPSTTWEEGCHLVSSWKHHFPKVLGSVPLLPQNLRMFLLTLLIAPPARHY